MARGLSFHGIGSHYTTFKLSASTAAVVAVSGASAIEGKAITLTGNEEVGFGSDGNEFFGVLNKYEGDGYVGVQDAGYFEDLPAVSGSVPTFGTRTLVVDGAGAVKSSGSVPTRGTVISSDDTANVNTVTVLIG
jgi:hypothetical protein